MKNEDPNEEAKETPATAGVRRPVERRRPVGRRLRWRNNPRPRSRRGHRAADHGREKGEKSRGSRCQVGGGADQEGKRRERRYAGGAGPPGRREDVHHKGVWGWDARGEADSPCLDRLRYVPCCIPGRRYICRPCRSSRHDVGKDDEEQVTSSCTHCLASVTRTPLVRTIHALDAREPAVFLFNPSPSRNTKPSWREQAMAPMEQGSDSIHMLSDLGQRGDNVGTLSFAQLSAPLPYLTPHPGRPPCLQLQEVGALQVVCVCCVGR